MTFTSRFDRQSRTRTPLDRRSLSGSISSSHLCSKLLTKLGFYFLSSLLTVTASAFPHPKLERPELAPLSPPSTALLQPVHFFENSVRSDITPTMAPFLVGVHLAARYLAANQGRSDAAYIRYVEKYFHGDPTCAAFFIQNDQQRMLVGSSRHCLNFRESELIGTEDVFVTDFATGSRGRPTRIIASDLGSDFFIFEVDFGSNQARVQSKRRALTLAYLDSPNQAPVQDFGFPTDPLRQRAPTKSDACTLFDRSYDPSFSKFYNPNFALKLAYDRHYMHLSSHRAVTEIPDIDVLTAQAYIFGNTDFIKHNCSIFSGNSGGPVVLAEYPEILVGIPETYDPKGRTFPSDHYGLMETPLRLMESQGNVLRAAGIHPLRVSRNQPN